MVTASLRYRYVVEDVDRHGNVRLYFRRHGRKTRMPGPVGSAGFVEAYTALLEGAASAPATAPAVARFGTLRDLVVSYQRSADFKRLERSTQRTQQLILDSILCERIRPDRPGDERTFADMPVEHMSRANVIVLRDRKASTPWASQRRVKLLSRLFAWAIESARPGVSTNPAAKVGKLSGRSDGWHTWTDAEVAQYEARWPVGTKQRLALDILLYAGARRSCAVMLGRQHERVGGTRLAWTAWKGRRKSPRQIDIPILAPLRRSLEAAPVGDLTYLVTDFGQPFSIAGFGNWFRAACDSAGLPNCSAHGLRKAGSTRAADNGATAHELMAMFGWTSLAHAELYTRTAERRRLATSGMGKILSHLEAAQPSHHGKTLKVVTKNRAWRSLRE